MDPNIQNKYCLILLRKKTNKIGLANAKEQEYESNKLYWIWVVWSLKFKSNDQNIIKRNSNVKYMHHILIILSLMKLYF